MTEKVKRPVARRTLYLAILEVLIELLETVKDEWFKQAK